MAVAGQESVCKAHYLYNISFYAKSRVISPFNVNSSNKSKLSYMSIAQNCGRKIPFCRKKMNNDNNNNDNNCNNINYNTLFTGSRFMSVR
jgi:hypothetical protein